MQHSTKNKLYSSYPDFWQLYKFCNICFDLALLLMHILIIPPLRPGVGHHGLCVLETLRAVMYTEDQAWPPPDYVTVVNLKRDYSSLIPDDLLLHRVTATESGRVRGHRDSWTKTKEKTNEWTDSQAVNELGVCLLMHLHSLISHWWFNPIDLTFDLLRVCPPAWCVQTLLSTLKPWLITVLSKTKSTLLDSHNE